MTCRLKEENERLAAELHVYRMRMIAEQTLRKIDSSRLLVSTPPQTPDHTPHTSPLFPHHHPPSPIPSPPQTPTTPRSPKTTLRRWSPLR